MVDITAEALAQMVADAVAAATAKKKTAKSGGNKKPTREPLTEEQKAANRKKTDILTMANFTAKGYKDVQPRVNVMTYNKWIENGRMVRKGEKSVKCGSFPLFHIDQTDPLPATKH
jgi:hypothetical protein